MNYLNHVPENCKIIGTYYIGEVKKRLYLEVECDVHGLFKIRCDDLKNRGCKQCKREEVKSQYDNQWKEECNLIHKNKYDYSQTEVGDVLKLSTIRCIECDTYFKQTPASHKSGKGCPKCGAKLSADAKRKTIEDVIIKCESMGRYYDFSKARYKTCKDKIKITCDKGHSFSTTPDEIFHSDRGCPKCSLGKQRSVQEMELYKFVNSIIKCEHSNRQILEGLEIDIFIPEFNLGIEYNGMYWHSDEKNKTPHFEKKLIASKKNIHLIHIYEEDWKEKGYVIRNKIVDLLRVKNMGFHCLPLNLISIQVERTPYVEDIYRKCSLDAEMSFDGFYTLRKGGIIHGIASYKEYKGSIMIKEVIRNPEAMSSNYYEIFLDFFIQNSFYFLVNIDWVEDLYLIQRGIREFVGISVPKKRVLINNKSYVKKSKEGSRTITKSGYAIYKF